jgi:hypothetical protein
MTQPAFAPVPSADTVRPALKLSTPGDWRANRVAELNGPQPGSGVSLGAPGPDQGYALKLGHDLFSDRLDLNAGERAEDAIYGAAMVASARSDLFGRAPVAPDLEMALTLFGFLGGAPADLLAWRLPRFQSVSHHYHEQRRIVDAIPESTLRMTTPVIRERLGDWKDLLTAAALQG